MSNDMVRPEIQALAERGNITLPEWEGLRMNSWESELLIPRLDDAALAHVTEHFVRNCRVLGPRPFATYDEAIVGLVVPELLRRLRRGSEDAHAALDLEEIPRYSDADEMPPDAELSLAERIRRLRRRVSGRG